MANTILRLPAVRQHPGLSRSTIYDAMTRGTFPKPVRLGVRTVGWLASEVDGWVAERVEARDRAAGSKVRT